jgi:hypothetical protein
VIPIDDIISTEPSHNPASSPALSLDRLVIRYGQGAELMISPKEMAEFIAELKKHLQRRLPISSAQETRQPDV